MKRLFIFVSFLCISIFLVFSINTQKEKLYFGDYPSVDITGLSNEKNAVNREELMKQLQQLGQETDSLIARRVVAPNKKGVMRFSYETYGSGVLPVGLNQSTEEEAESSNLINSYLIVSGSLTPHQLSQKINDLGYENRVFDDHNSLINNILSTSINITTLVSLLICILTFIGMSIVIRVKRLKYAGIELISGESIFKVISKPIYEDTITLLGSCSLTSIIGIGLLYHFNILSTKFAILLTTTLLIYAGILLLMSIVLSLIDITNLKKSSLMRLIKGSLPMKKLMALMLFSQFLSIILLSLTTMIGFKFYTDYQEQVKSEQKWEQYQDYYNAQFGMGTMAAKTLEDNYNYFLPFKQLAADAITNHDAILVVKNYENANESQTEIMQDKSKIESLYVNLNYLNHEGIQISSEFQNKVNDFQEGEFALILPKKLENQKQAIIKKYKEEIQNYASETPDIRSKKVYSVKEPLVMFVENNQNRFLFNKSNFDGLQFVKDPVIVLINDKSISKTISADYFFWGTNSVNSVYYKNYDQTIELLKKHGIYQEVPYLENINTQYLNSTNDLKVQLISILVGAILAIITSIILFSTMNLLYFQQFRRDIFIKKISGLSFFEIHKKYLITEVVILILGSVMSVVLFKDLTPTESINSMITIGSFIMMITILIIILSVQNKKEQQTAMTVMKGK